MPTLLLIFASLFAASLAQRPSSSSICDYYTQVRFGSATKEHQFQLIQGIVSLAFGGPGLIPAANVSSELTGILNPGVHNGVPVNLLPFFNGSLPSTNLNNQPIGINWLDDGGLVPLNDFLNGKTDGVVLAPSSNEYRLFGHFYTAFARIFGCSDPPANPPSAGGPLNLAYAHKFMSLKFDELGYFINQLTLSAQYFGFSETDAQSLNTRMNSQYNVRCAPAITFNPKSGPQLLSLCQDPTCPLAVPDSDCEAYVNLTANGAASSAPSDSSATTLPSATSIVVSPASPTSSETTSTSAASSSSNAPVLSAGGIAGVAIGGVAVIAFIIAIIFFFRRKRHPATHPEVPETHQNRWTTDTFGGSQAGGGGGGQGYLSPQSEQYNAYSPDSRHSYLSQAHTAYGPVELVSPKFPPVQPVELSGDTTGADGYRQ